MTNFNDLCMNCFEERHGKNPCPSCGVPIRKSSGNGISLQPGAILSGKYLVGKILGQGGFGITYLGFDLNLKSKIAIKEYFLNGFVTRKSGNVIPLNRQYLESFREGVELFYHEAESLAKFRSNPVIVNVYDFFRENGTAYIVLEYITGTPLSAYLLKRGGKIEYTETLKILTPVMEALSALHEVNLLHRDISPDNILLAADGRIRLIDFGAAMPAMKGNRENLPTVLKTGYAPIEQYTLTGKQGPWTDLYALAATFYLCITGESIPGSTDRMTDDPLINPAEKGVALPAPSDRAIMKALSVQPEERFRSVADFRAELERPEEPADPPRSQSSGSKQSEPEKAPEKCRNPKKTSKKQPRNHSFRNSFIRFGILCAVYLALANGLNVLIGNPLKFVFFPVIPELKPAATSTAVQTAPSSEHFTETATAVEPTETAAPKSTGTSLPTEDPTSAPIKIETTLALPPNSDRETVSPSETESTLPPPRSAEPTFTATSRRAENRVRQIDKMTEVNIVAGSTEFWIDIREVSAQQYVNYVIQTGKIGGKASNTANDSPLNPITNVSRAEAAGYCAWIGGRLPTLREWLIAANPDASPNFDENFRPDVNLQEINCDSLRVNSVDNFQFPANQNGIHDMYGNVWEWVNGASDAEIIDRYRPGSDIRFIIAGGSWRSECHSILDPASLIETGSDRDDVGFRCVRDD